MGSDRGHSWRLVSVSDGTALGYDGNGNVLTRTVGGAEWRYVYDPENRLVEAWRGAERVVTFRYDAEGNRVVREVSGLRTVAVDDGYEVRNGVVRKVYRLGGEAVAVREGGGVWAVVGDPLGSVTVLAQGGSVAGATRYLPYGAIRWESGVFPTDRRFTGQRWEGTLGLYDYRARFYDPALGRFLQPDPLVPEPGNPQALNRYAYVYHNPLRYTDPSGHAACIDEGCALLAPPGNPRPFLRIPAPRAITFIHREMVRNAQSKIATAIHMANAIARWPLCPSCVLGGKTLAFTLWTSQVMDAQVKNYAGPLAPLLGNWDHKPILYPENPQQQSPVPKIVWHKGWSTVGSTLYRFDIWSNIHYGYVGRATGFSQPELTGGAGVEQIGSDLYNYGHTHQWPHRSPRADNWAASWDDPSDNAAIQIGIRLWDQYGLAVKPADIYLAVLEEPRLATSPFGGTP